MFHAMPWNHLFFSRKGNSSGTVSYSDIWISRTRRMDERHSIFKQFFPHFHDSHTNLDDFKCDQPYTVKFIIIQEFHWRSDRRLISSQQGSSRLVSTQLFSTLLYLTLIWRHHNSNMDNSVTHSNNSKRTHFLLNSATWELLLPFRTILWRSEERRVGKEC